MKYCLSISLLCGFLSFVCCAGNSITKIYIDDGILSGCHAPDELDAAVKLYVIDLHSNEMRLHYLPGSISVSGNQQKKTEPAVRFPLAWSCCGGVFRMIFPNLLSDAKGRISFRLWSAQNIFDLQTRQTMKGFINENRIMRYRGYWHGESILFMNSVPFAVNSITDESNHIWYDLDCRNVIARIPISEAQQTAWNPSVPPQFYKWLFYSVEKKEILSCEDTRNNDFIPLAAIRPRGKQFFMKGENIDKKSIFPFPENADWLIWGVDQHDKPKLLTVFLSNGVHLKMEDCPLLPELILFNADSGYILFSFDAVFHSSKAETSFHNLVEYLRNKNLLKNDSKQER